MGSLVSVADVAQHLVDIVDPSRKLVLGAVADRLMEQVRVANITDTFEKIGYKPNTPLSVGLQKTVEWYRNYEEYYQ